MNYHFKTARKNMTDGQLRPNRITQPDLLEALSSTPRELFVPPLCRKASYSDGDIDVGNGRYIMNALVLAWLVQAADIKKTDVVLDIGCSTGYSTAILAALASTVIGIENNHDQAHQADPILRDLGILNAVIIEEQNIQNGYGRQAPYDVILLNGSVPRIPDTLKNQMADGGRLVAVISQNNHSGSGVLLTRHGDKYASTHLFDAYVEPLAEFREPKAFVL